MTVPRRGFLHAAGGLAAAASMSTFYGCAGFAPGDLPGALPYGAASVRSGRLTAHAFRVRIGRTVVTAVSDGATTMQGRPLPSTFFVVERGAWRVLLDAGAGPLGTPDRGRLVSNLKDIGIDPASIHAILISHFHVDHIGGLHDADGGRAFPNARLSVPAHEWNYWIDGARPSAAPNALRDEFEVARRIFRLFGGDAPAVQRFAPGSEQVAGLQPLAAYGHTPGHTAYTLSSGGHQFAYLGDVVSFTTLSTSDGGGADADDMEPDDMEPTAARVTRRRLLDAAVAGNWIVAACHLPFPAIGRIVSKGTGYDFVPMGA